MNTYYGLDLLEKDASISGRVELGIKKLKSFVPGVTAGRVKNLNRLNDSNTIKKIDQINASGYHGAKPAVIEQHENNSERIRRAAAGQHPFSSAPHPELSSLVTHAY